MNREPPLRLPSRATGAHKGDFGRALLVGASRGMSGSIAMSAIAALRCGAGLVTAAVPDRCLETVASFHPSIMTLAIADDSSGCFAMQAAEQLVERFSSSSAIGCGPGMTTRPGSIRIVERLVQATSIPRVLDADAVNSLALLRESSGASPGSPSESDPWPSQAGPLVLTPHPGELERLTGVSAGDSAAQLSAAKDLAANSRMVIVVKGGPTVVVGPDQCWTNTTGNPGMATAGSGDVLTGVITALLGQGLSPWDAACLGVWVHGLAGDLAADEHGQSGMTAREILDALPRAIAAVH